MNSRFFGLCSRIEIGVWPKAVIRYWQWMQLTPYKSNVVVMHLILDKRNNGGKYTNNLLISLETHEKSCQFPRLKKSKWIFFKLNKISMYIANCTCIWYCISVTESVLHFNIGQMPSAEKSSIAQLIYKWIEYFTKCYATFTMYTRGSQTGWIFTRKRR